MRGHSPNYFPAVFALIIAIIIYFLFIFDPRPSKEVEKFNTLKEQMVGLQSLQKEIVKKEREIGVLKDKFIVTKAKREKQKITKELKETKIALGQLETQLKKKASEYNKEVQKFKSRLKDSLKIFTL